MSSSLNIQSPYTIYSIIKLPSETREEMREHEGSYFSGKQKTAQLYVTMKERPI